MDDKTPARELEDLLRRLSRALSDQMGFPVRVARNGTALVLTGEADAESSRAEAEDTVAELMPNTGIANLLTVNPRRRRHGESYVDHDRRGDRRPLVGLESLELAEGRELDPGFDDQPLETNAINVSNDSVVDLDDPAEPDPAYFAPTDPVIGTDDEGGPQIVGGFEPTSLSDDDVDRSTLDGRPGDEAIADAVRRALREDAETAGLSLRVDVLNGVVRLRGWVADVTDAEDAEEVASRVPGVREVIDETVVSSRRRQ